jgi:hypothetical protein
MAKGNAPDRRKVSLDLKDYECSFNLIYNRNPRLA